MTSTTLPPEGEGPPTLEDDSGMWRRQFDKYFVPLLVAAMVAAGGGVVAAIETRAQVRHESTSNAEKFRDLKAADAATNARVDSLHQWLLSQRNVAVHAQDWTNGIEVPQGVK